MGEPIHDNTPGNFTIHIPKLRSKRDVRAVILGLGDAMRKFGDDYLSRLIRQISVSKEMFARSRYMRLGPDGFETDLFNGLFYMTHLQQNKPLVPEMARNCKTCRQCWPSFVHFLFTPSAPKYLECPECTKRIPVGVDIHVLPERKLQPNKIGIYDRPLDLESIEGDGAGPTISTEQRCTSPSCPLKDFIHPIGLFSYPLAPKPAVPTQSTELSASPNKGIPEFYLEADFWGGNDKIPRGINAYAAAIVREEAIFRAGDRIAIESFRKKYPREKMDSMREAVDAFRAFHCGYEVLSISKSLQLDQYPEHLRTGKPGSKLWVHAYVARLPKIATETLAEDDRECGICRGVYDKDVGMGGEVENAVKMPCSHVLGAGCVAELFLEKKSGGMGHFRCPLCRTLVYEPTLERPWEEYPTSLTLDVNYDAPPSEGVTRYEG